MKLKTLIAIPLIITALLFVGIKVYIYYTVKTELDDAIQKALPIVQVRYGAISSDLNGTISIEDIHINPTGSYEEIRIQKVSVSGNGPRFLFDLTRGFKNSEPPEKLSIRFNRLESPISTNFIGNLATNFGGKDKLTWKDETEVCSMATIFRGSGLRELGFPGISINGGIGFNYDKIAANMKLDLDYELSGVESSQINLQMSGLTPAGVLGLGTPPSIENVSIRREMDPGYIKQMITMCSGNAGSTPEQFIDTATSGSDRHYLKSFGFIPGPGIKQAFKAMLTNPGVLEIKAEPANNVNPATLSAYKPSDLVQLLGISVRHNNQEISDLSFSTSLKKKPSGQAKVASAENQRPSIVKPQKPEKPQAKKKRPRMRYIPTDIGKLPEYLNYRVRIYTLDNSIPKQGVLKSINNRTINVEEHLYNGKMTAHLHTTRIERIEVLRLIR